MVNAEIIYLKNKKIILKKMVSSYYEIGNSVKIFVFTTIEDSKKIVKGKANKLILNLNKFNLSFEYKNIKFPEKINKYQKLSTIEFIINVKKKTIKIKNNFI